MRLPLLPPPRSINSPLLGKSALTHSQASAVLITQPKRKNNSFYDVMQPFATCFALMQFMKNKACCVVPCFSKGRNNI